MSDPFSDWRARRIAMETLARRILGVAEGASLAELKKAYRRMARQTHPDINPDGEKSEAKFLNVKSAYQVLARGKEELLVEPELFEKLEGMDPEQYMNWWKDRWG